METWDVYDEHGACTGKTKTRADHWEPDEYHLGASLWIVNDERELLIQRRSGAKRRFPNLWCSIGGSALSGESSRRCCAREALEEVGIVVQEGDLAFLKRFVFPNTLNDDYVIIRNVSIEELRMQPGEVDDVRWASLADIQALHGNGLFLLGDADDLIPISRFLSGMSRAGST